MVQLLHALGVDVDADDLEPRLRHLDGQRQAHVAQPDHGQAGGALLQTLFQGGGGALRAGRLVGGGHRVGDRNKAFGEASIGAGMVRKVRAGVAS